MVDDGLEFRRQEHGGLNSMSTFNSAFFCWCGDLLGNLFSVFNSIETVIEKEIESCNFPEDLVSAFFDRNPESLDLFTYVDRLLGHFVQNTPIGHVETQPGRCIVFPNVFQHKMKGMHSPTSTTQQQKQKLLYFFLVDPDRPIPSTLSIKPQQKGYYTNLYFDLLKNVKMKGELLPLQIIHHILNYLVSDLSLEEALELRVKCMHERGLISDRRTRAFENKYRLNSYQ
ncbi:hypothetical protein HMI55_001471 [Coelomomyces lativittatus]|nr:hypothetical protein HMI55_001471 [Coelomomyces lativittatus]